jgi:hypothetical protein
MEHRQREQVSEGPDPGTSLPPHGPNDQGGAGIIYSHLEIVKACGEGNPPRLAVLLQGLRGASGAGPRPGPGPPPGESSPALRGT